MGAEAEPSPPCVALGSPRSCTLLSKRDILIQISKEEIQIPSSFLERGDVMVKE